MASIVVDHTENRLFVGKRTDTGEKSGLALP